jgi:spore germination cell wall hydrolase CwlJ-like protein
MKNQPQFYSLPNADHESAKRLQRELEIDTIARTIWGEARGEGVAGMQAVASVILNRVAVADRFGGYWWGNTILEVCHKPYQFSCWNKTDPNFRKLISVTDEDQSFAMAKRIATRAILGFVQDATYGATHYHERSILPYWAKGQTPSAVIGRHIFYKLIEGKIERKDK